MLIGKVEFIYITAKKGDPTVPVEKVHAVPGKGLEGDRYFDETSTGLKRSGTGHEITLIELEAIEAMQQENGIPITPDQTRRNIVTRGVQLNDLVGYEFSIGDIHLHGVRLCEPCQYLAKRIDQRILSAMAHRGGLRADILTDGIIHVHDLIKIGN